MYIEIKRLEQNERRFSKEREELMKTVAGIESGLNVHQPDEEAFSGLFIDPRRKRKKGDGVDTDSPSSAGPSSGPTRRIVSAKQAAFGSILSPPTNLHSHPAIHCPDAQNCIIRGEIVATTAPSTKTAHVPAHLRSTKLPVPKASIAPKVSAMLGELGVSHTRLVMPTQANIARLEVLLDAAAMLIDTKKSVDRIDQEIRTQKKLLGLGGDENEAGENMGNGEVNGERSEDDPRETGGETAVNADAMDVDREDVPEVAADVTRKQVCTLFVSGDTVIDKYCQDSESQAIVIYLICGDFRYGRDACQPR